MVVLARSCIGGRRGARGRRPPSELARDVRSATQAARHVPLDLGSKAAAAATACFGLLEAINFVSNRTSRPWDVHFDRTTVDLSTDGRIQAREIPCGPGEALGPVRRAIPGRRVASEGYALFCIDFRYNVSIFVTCVSNRPLRALCVVAFIRWLCCGSGWRRQQRHGRLS